MSGAFLQGLAVALNNHLTAVRRHAEAWDEDRLRHELALAAAMVDCAREAIGEQAIAARADEASKRVRERRFLELGCAEGYQLWAPSYDDTANVLIALEQPALERLIGEATGRRVLDVGCGTGRWALELAARGAEVTGVDPCPEMLERARAAAEDRGLQVEWTDAGFGELPRSGDFDLVLCNLVLCHLPDIEGPIAEMAQCLRPAGRLIVSDFHYLCLVIGWRTAFDAGGQAYHIENYLHDYGDYFRAFRRAGLTVTAIEDVRVDETLRDHGMEGLVDHWLDFPVCQVVVGDRTSEAQGG